MMVGMSAATETGVDRLEVDRFVAKLGFDTENLGIGICDVVFVGWTSCLSPYFHSL